MKQAAVLVLLAACGACKLSAPAPVEPTEGCGENQHLSVSGRRFLHSESDFETTPARRVSRPFDPDAVGKHASELQLAPEGLRLEGIDTLLWPEAAAPDCSRLGAETVDIPPPLLGFFAAGSSMKGIWQMPDGVIVSVVEFGAHSWEPGGTSITFRFPDGRATAYIVGRSRDIFRLPSGEFIVEGSKYDTVTIAEAYAGVAWQLYETDLSPGAFRITADGSVQTFPTRLGSLVLWGSNRIWEWRGRRRVVGSDMDARPFFRIRQDADIAGVMPFRDGVCLALVSEKIRCFDVDEQMTLEVRIEGLRSAVVDRSGRVYALGDGRLVAYDPAGATLWQDPVENAESDLVLAPSLGLCYVAPGAKLVCYAPLEDGETRASARDAPRRTPPLPRREGTPPLLAHDVGQR